MEKTTHQIADSCGNCRFMHRDLVRGVQPVTSCRRYPRQAVAYVLPQQAPDGIRWKPVMQGIFPTVEPDDWCGEFQPVAA